METEPRELINLESAIARLPEGDEIHTFRQAPCSHGLVLIGADWPRERLIGAMREAPNIEVSGPHAQAMGHGLAIYAGDDWLFIATKLA